MMRIVLHNPLQSQMLFLTVLTFAVQLVYRERKSNMNKLSRDRQAQVIAALVEGNSIRAIERMTGVAKHTIGFVNLVWPLLII
jgi:hypothetical protein